MTVTYLKESVTALTAEIGWQLAATFWLWGIDERWPFVSTRANSLFSERRGMRSFPLGWRRVKRSQSFCDRHFRNDFKRWPRIFTLQSSRGGWWCMRRVFFGWFWWAVMLVSTRYHQHDDDRETPPKPCRRSLHGLPPQENPNSCGHDHHRAGQKLSIYLYGVQPKNLNIRYNQLYLMNKMWHFSLANKFLPLVNKSST